MAWSTICLSQRISSWWTAWNHKWPLLIFLLAFAQWFVAGYLKKKIGAFVIKQAWNILKHFNFINMEKTNLLLEKIGLLDAYSVALELV